MRFWHIFTVIGCLIGALQLLVALSSTSAPQQAAGAACAVAFAVIPYCFARAVIFMSHSSAEVQLMRINETLSAQGKAHSATN